MQILNSHGGDLIFADRIMVVVLAATCFVLLVGLISAVVGLVTAKIQLAKYSVIKDEDEYRKQCQEQVNNLKLTGESYAKEIARGKQLYAKYAEVIGECKTAAEAKAKAEGYRAEIEKYRSVIGEAKTAAECQQQIHKLRAEIIRLTSEAQAKSQAFERELEQFKAVIGEARTAAECQQYVTTLKAELSLLQQQLSTAQENVGFEQVGIYPRRYDYDHPEQFKMAIDRNVAAQKSMVKAGTACQCFTEWLVEGSKQKGQKMVNEQMRLMLRAFNGECDAAIARVKHNNITTVEKRIRKCFEQLNKLGATKQISISDHLLSLRLEELHLSHQYELAKEVQREKQREIKESMQEEARAEREIEEAKRRAEKEEADKLQALELAHQQLAQEHGAQNEKLAKLVAKLELELSEAIDRKAKAIARAQLTRSGHVYVLSNVGTMGTGRYKIGMTRRLVPDERVKELGDASVPFPFDIHAMIYTENAPALEAALHKHFDHRRVNMVNARKEYFDVSLEEIMAATAKYHGVVTYLLEHPAEQYRESLAIKAEMHAGMVSAAEAQVA